MIFSRKPAKHYFIDSENVNDVWVEGIVQSLGLKDHIYIFYSENSTHMKSDSVRRLMELGADRVTWIRCYIGTNALDFQLVTVLGAVAANGRSEDEFVIVSNDAGFDAVVQFWQDQGREVSRLKMDTSAGKPKRHNKARKPVRKFQSQKPDIKPETEKPPWQKKERKKKPKTDPEEMNNMDILEAAYAGLEMTMDDPNEGVEIARLVDAVEHAGYRFKADTPMKSRKLTVTNWIKKAGSGFVKDTNGIVRRG